VKGASQLSKGRVTAVQRCIGLDSPREWANALEGMEHSFAHTWESCYAMHLSTGFATYLYCFEAKNARIVCPIAERTFENHTDVVTPYGFSGFIGNGNRYDFSRYWSDFAKRNGYVCGYIGLNPIFENSTYFGAEEIYEYNEIFVIDLTKSIDSIFVNLNSNRRRELRKARKDALSQLIFDRDVLIDFFLANYHDFFARKDASQVYQFSNETLSFLLNLENTLIVGAEKSGRVEAVTVFAYTPYAADFLFNISLSEGRQHSVPLIWSALDHLKSLQVPLLNLGGGVRKNDSLAHFKRQFGGRRLPLRCIKQVYNSETYEMLCRRVDADPTDMGGYFPAYQKPYSLRPNG
jgi:hypothetical protein